jgi:SAM-dependent methyltransferase
MTHDLDLQLDYWNEIGPTKPFAHPVNVERLEQLVSKSSRILDYGCGYGRAIGVLQANGFVDLVGVDPAPAMIVAARKSYPSVLFEVVDRDQKTSLPDAAVDAVLLLSVLTCVPTNEGQRAIVAEITRLLRPGGVFYISDYFLQTDPRNVERYIAFEKKYGTYGVFDLREGATVRHHTPEWIESLVAGYELLSQEEIPIQTMNGHPATAFQWFGRKRSAMRETL